MRRELCFLFVASFPLHVQTLIVVCPQPKRIRSLRRARGQYPIGLRTAVQDESLQQSSLQSRNESEHSDLWLPDIQAITFLKQAIQRLCLSGEIDKAIQLLDQREQHQKELSDSSSFTSLGLDAESYTLVMHSLASQSTSEADADRVQGLLKRMKRIPGCSPTCTAYNAVILAWSRSYHTKAGFQSEALLRELWTKYNETQQVDDMPTASTYISALTAYSRSNTGKLGAEKAEALLEEMEKLRRKGYPTLGPNTVAVNIVL
jgi:hypothetical protein